MAVLSWGKPKVEVGVLGSGDAAPSNWIVFPEIVKDTAKLNTEAGAETVANEEGGGIVDTRREKNKYVFECEIFIKKGDSKPVEDEDGVISDNVAVRWTPEDPTNKGRIIDKASVSVVETWSSADGGRWKYTFTGLIPKEGKILKEYTPGVTPPSTEE